MFQLEYMSSVINVSTNSVKSPDQTKADFVQLNLPRVHEEIG